MPEQIHDCIVVGAGPAGSAAALELAREGLDVVLLERGTRPGEKNVMGGILFTGKLHTLIPSFRDRAPLQRRVTESHWLLLDRDGALRLPALRNYRRLSAPDAPHTVFRSEFDAWFAGEAVAAGAELFTSTLVEDLLWEEGRVRARVVIGADGVNSTVAEKAGLRPGPSPHQVWLMAREVLDLPAQRIEERFALRPGEGMTLDYYVDLPQLFGGEMGQGACIGLLYTNRDSLSLAASVMRLELARQRQVAVQDILEAVKRHPYISRLIDGTELREYQAHLIPVGGVADLSCLYGGGVLLAGDAGRFNTWDGTGSWPAMASGRAAARAVKAAFERGDFSARGLDVYRELLDEEGLIANQRQARRVALGENRHPELVSGYLSALFHVARRYQGDWETGQEEHRLSLWGEIYQRLVRPVAPWYVRWPLGLLTAVGTWRWRRRGGVS